MKKGQPRTKSMVKKERLASITKRMTMALSPAHFASAFLHPDFSLDRLSPEQILLATDWLQLKGINLSFLSSWGTKDYSCLEVPVAAKIMESASSLTLKEFWQRAALFTRNANVQKVATICLDLTGLVSSTASQERTFSLYSATWTKLRNRLSNDNTKMLVFLRQRFSQKRKMASEEKKKQRELEEENAEEND